MSSTPTTRRSAPIPALTGLRFFAAMAVVVSHFSEQHVVYLPAGVFNFLDGGRTAVSLFFVLSGFVLAYNYVDLDGPLARRRFYAARFARIYPVVVLALVVALPTVAYARTRPDVLLQWFAIKSHPSSSLAASLASQVTMTTGWLPLASINQPWNSPAWSISCELFFYALFPWLIIRLRTWDNRRLIMLAIAGLGTQAAWVLAIKSALPPSRSGFLVSQFPVTHTYEFALGVASAVWFLRGGRSILAHGNRRTRALGLAIAVLALLSWIRPVHPVYLLLSPFFALLVLALAAPARGRSLLAVSWLTVLGESSYALYLLHLPAVHLMQIAGWHGSLGWLGMAVVVALTVPVFHWYETPLRRALNVRLRDTRHVRVARSSPRAPSFGRL